MNLKNIAISAGLLGGLAVGSVGVGAQPATDAPVKAGEMRCGADLRADEGRLVEVGLVCRVAPADGVPSSFEIDGTLVGSDLYLRAAGPEMLVWDVYTVSGDVGPDAMAGDYDQASAQGFELDEVTGPHLYGGAGGRVALVLREPSIDALNPSTRLIVRP